MAATAAPKEKKPRRVGKRAAAKLAEANGGKSKENFINVFNTF